jgi:hypothetical protein
LVEAFEETVEYEDGEPVDIPEEDEDDEDDEEEEEDDDDDKGEVFTFEILLGFSPLDSDDDDDDSLRDL